MTTLELDQGPAANRAALLKQATHTAHERLDVRIMAADPFSSRQRYARFVQVQFLFHRDIDALYDRDVGLTALLPNFAERRRLGLIEADLHDLGVDAPAADRAPAFAPGVAIDGPNALGWLYVAEGSNLGAAFLLKEAAKLGLSESFGARHLAAAPEGRGRHWKAFVGALDAVPLSAGEEANAIAGAKDAFARVRELVERLLPSQAVTPSASRSA